MTAIPTDIARNPLDAPPWCRDADGVEYSYDQFLDRITAFHGYPAPGLIIGGKMVAVALAAMPAGSIFDAICETGTCLPDAIQLLTPCTAGNGWLKVLDLGRFALALYDKRTGQGCRVALDPEKIAAWPQIDLWFFKRKPKADQDFPALLAEIQRAGARILKVETVQVHPRIMVKNEVGPRALCPQCGESYPLKHGPRCLACQGASPYSAQPLDQIHEDQFDKGV